MSDTVSRLNAALEGRYEIERELAVGGMATVYLARDLRHERRVALKVLKRELAAVVGTDRFLSEIRTTANLQHPHILPLFDSGEADGFLYYVMPYVEGESLRQRLDRERQLPVEEGIRIAVDVAEALEYAHGHGIVHRDVKPANVLLHAGRPLIADFGIAVALDASGGRRVTETGLSLGTPHYMSPEQATGDVPVGPATDIYALGCVLYEMMLGVPPYAGSTTQAVLGKIVMGTLEPVREQRSSVPLNVEATIGRALEKVPADRFGSAGELAEALADPRFRHGGTRASVASQGTRATLVRYLLAVVGLAALVLLWARWPLGDQPAADPVRLAVSLPADQRPSVRFWESPVALSPDGKVLAYTAVEAGTSRLFIRRMAEFESSAVPGTGGAVTPFFAPDGSAVGFVANGRLWRVSVSGGAPLPIGTADRVRFGAHWGVDGSIYYGDDSGLRRVPAAGGSAEVVSPVDAGAGEIARGFPQVLPNGLVLVTVLARGGDRVEVLDPYTGESQTVIEGGVGAHYVPSGHLVFGGAGVMQAVAFDLGRSAVTSSPISLPDRVLISEGGTPRISVSDDGTLVYVPSDVVLGGDPSGVSRSGTLVLVSEDGRETRLWEDWPGAGNLRLSPDGDRAVDHVPADPADVRSNFHVWVFDLVRGTSDKLTSEGTNIFPIWAPDGRRVAYSSSVGGPMSLYWAAADGTGETEPLVVRDVEQFITAWSADGSLLAYSQRDPSTGSDLWVLPMDGEREPRPFLRSEANETSLVFSPDAEWVAYVSDTSGRPEVYVQPRSGRGGRTLVSNAGGQSPRWAPDGRRLFYRRGRELWAVRVRTQSGLDVGTPELLFAGPYSAGLEVDAHGRGFVTVRFDPPDEPSRFQVVQNWATELERLLPPGG